LTPHISPIWGSGKPNLLFPWGCRQGLPCCQNLRGSPQIRLFQKIMGGAYGVLTGLPLSEWRTNFFEHLPRKNPDPFFHFFRISTQGLSYAPSKNGQILDFLKKFTKNRSRERNIRGATNTKYLGGRTTLWWGRFSPPHPPIFLGSQNKFSKFRPLWDSLPQKPFDVFVRNFQDL